MRTVCLFPLLEPDFDIYITILRWIIKEKYRKDSSDSQTGGHQLSDDVNSCEYEKIIKVDLHFGNFLFQPFLFLEGWWFYTLYLIVNIWFVQFNSHIILLLTLVPENRHEFFGGDEGPLSADIIIHFQRLEGQGFYWIRLEAQNLINVIYTLIYFVFFVLFEGVSVKSGHIDHIGFVRKRSFVLLRLFIYALDAVVKKGVVDGPYWMLLPPVSQLWRVLVGIPWQSYFELVQKLLFLMVYWLAK